jgi:hypothetical protein
MVPIHIVYRLYGSIPQLEIVKLVEERKRLYGSGRPVRHGDKAGRDVRNRQNHMAKKKTPTTPKEIAAHTHEEAKRTNIPSAEMQPILAKQVAAGAGLRSYWKFIAKIYNVTFMVLLSNI